MEFGIESETNFERLKARLLRVFNGLLDGHPGYRWEELRSGRPVYELCRQQFKFREGINGRFTSFQEVHQFLAKVIVSQYASIGLTVSYPERHISKLSPVDGSISFCLQNIILLSFLNADFGTQMNAKEAVFYKELICLLSGIVAGMIKRTQQRTNSGEWEEARRQTFNLKAELATKTSLISKMEQQSENFNFENRRLQELLARAERERERQEEAVKEETQLNEELLRANFRLEADQAELVVKMEQFSRKAKSLEAELTSYRELNELCIESLDRMRESKERAEEEAKVAAIKLRRTAQFMKVIDSFSGMLQTETFNAFQAANDWITRSCAKEVSSESQIDRNEFSEAKRTLVKAVGQAKSDEKGKELREAMISQLAKENRRLLSLCYDLNAVQCIHC